LAFAFNAEVTFWASYAVTGACLFWIVNALAIYAFLIVGAFDASARIDALTIAAELSIWASDTITRICLTKAIDTALAFGTSAQIAVIF
jgi:hypothetical protein